jgi:hypothetical protein
MPVCSYTPLTLRILSEEVKTMALLDLQGLEIPGGEGCGGGGGGSGLTIATCQSQTPSNLSAVLCH